MTTAKTVLGATPETWVKIVVPILAGAILGAFAWSFRVESTMGRFATKDHVQKALRTHAADGIHKGAATAEEARDLRKRIQLVERNQASFETTLRNIEKGIDEIKRDVRLLSRRKVRTP